MMRLSMLLLLVACQTPTTKPFVTPSGQNFLPTRIAVSSAGVFWIEISSVDLTGRIMRAALDGTGVTMVADGEHCAVDIAADDTQVFWVRCDGAVMSAPAGGGASTTLVAATNGDIPLAMALSSDRVFWLLSNNIQRVSKTPGSAPGPTVLALTTGAKSQLAADENNVYWTDGSSTLFYRINADSVAIPGHTLAGAQTLWEGRIAVDSANVYWVTGDTSVRSAPINGGNVTTIATDSPGGDNPQGVAVGGGFVYWNGTSHIQRAPVGGGAATLIANSDGEVSDLAVGATNVYWLGNGVYLAPR
jgi:hypothetical protein